MAKLEDLRFQTERGLVVVTSVYLSGPMTGIDEYNFPAFREATAAIRAKGIAVHSPHEMDEDEGYTAPQGPTPVTYTSKYFRFLQRDVELIGSGKVDAGVFLPGWQASRGARIEYNLIRDLALVTLSYPSLEWLEYRPAGRR